MDTAEEILVVYLSIALAVFLVIAIIAGVNAIKLLQTLQRIADKAENFATSAEAVGQVVKQTRGALSLSRFVKGIANFAHKHQEKSKEESKE